MNLLDHPRSLVAVIATSAILAAAVGLWVIATRNPASPEVTESPESSRKSSKQSQTSKGASSPATEFGPSTSAAAPAVSKAMDKTMARSLTQTFVEAVDRADARSVDRLGKALIDYKEVGREVIDELRAREPHLSDAAKIALEEVYAQAH